MGTLDDYARNDFDKSSGPKKQTAPLVRNPQRLNLPAKTWDWGQKGAVTPVKYEVFTASPFSSRLLSPWQ